MFGVLEALGDEVDRLVLGDGIFLLTSFLRLEGAELWFARHAPLQLTKGGEQAGSVRLTGDTVKQINNSNTASSSCAERNPIPSLFL